MEQHFHKESYLSVPRREQLVSMIRFKKDRYRHTALHERFSTLPQTQTFVRNTKILPRRGKLTD